MLISCTSCKSKYLVNSADLKPNGRNVQCIKCENQWFQDLFINKDEQFDEEILTSAPSISKKAHIKKNDTETTTPNLPSTYVKEQKVSILNSFLVVLLILFLIGGFWLFQNLEVNNLILIKFYFDEFIFNLTLIFDDIANIIYQVFN
jgi:predicted Zn finger-like uncharacterized protein